MEREVGGGIGMGNTCKPMAVSFQCMTKSTTNKKKIKIKKKKTILKNYPPKKKTHYAYVESVCSFVSGSFRSHRHQSARLLCPWDSLGKNTGVGCYFLLQGIFLTQGSNLHLLLWQIP